MHEHSSVRRTVDHQLRAYNARDIDAYCALFAPDAVIYRLDTGQALARGIEQIRAYYTERFRNPQLCCRIKARMELAGFIVDHERVMGIGPDVLEVIAIYEVRDSLIHTVRFIWPDRGSEPNDV
jgi:uncharacterized protein (TIGR02246 family)